METVKLAALLHNGVECIGIYAPQTRLPSGEPLNYYFQKKAGARWGIAWKEGAGIPELSALLYSIEAKSEHPLAEAIVKYFDQQKMLKVA